MINVIAPRNRHKKWYLSLFLLVMMPSLSTYAQLAELSLLESLTENQLNQNVTSESENEIDDGEEGPTKSKAESNFADENYGYTGGKNFITPPQSKFSDEPLSYFGYDFFADVPSTFAQATNIPIPPGYVIGPKDIIKIILSFRNRFNELAAHSIFFNHYGIVMY